MFKKLLASALAGIMIFGSAAVFPDNTGLYFTVLEASAESYNGFIYNAIDDETVSIHSYHGKESILTIPDTINGKKVVCIGPSAFWECTTLKEVIIPEGITDIGESAFNGCTFLSSITIPKSVIRIGGGAFTDTPWLKAQIKKEPLFIVNDILVDGTAYAGNAVIPDNVVSICDGAFRNNNTLTGVVISNGISAIGSGTFMNCIGLRNVDIPDSVTTIGYDVFNNCTGLTSIKLPKTLKDIYGNVFLNCSKLKDIVLPETIDYLGDNIFIGTQWLEDRKQEDPLVIVCGHLIDGTNCKGNISIPNGVTHIVWNAFLECDTITSVYIPESVTDSSISAFKNCENLEAINVSENNPCYSSIDGILYDKDKKQLITFPKAKRSAIIPEGITNTEMLFKDCRLLTEVKLPDSITIIDSHAFENCTGLTSITIPNNVTSIGGYAFYGCSSLKSIAIPSGVTEIGNSAFRDCTSLTDISIPESVTNIETWAFDNCSSLKTITVSGDNPIYSVIDGVLYNTKEGTIVFCPWSKEYVSIADGTKEINCDTFYGCKHLKRITIPKSVKNIEDVAFTYCTELEEIIVDEGNPNYTSENGILYDKKKQNLIICPPKTALKSLTLSGKVQRVYDLAFRNCTGLKDLTVLGKNTELGYNSFGYYNRLYYDDTETDIEDTLINGATIHCYSDSLAKEYAVNNRIKYELLDKPTHVHSYTKKVVKPTYDSEGYTLHTCSCGDSYKDNIKPKLTRTSIAKASISGLSSKYYSGNAITQTPIVKLGSKTLKEGTDYTVSYKNNKAIGTATVTITGKGAYTGTAKTTFKICPKKTTLKSATSPKSKQLKVTYSKVTGVTGYQVTYSTSSKFTKATTQSANASGTSKTISKLTKGKTYYVKVRTYKTVNGAKYYSGYSVVKKVTIN